MPELADLTALAGRRTTALSGGQARRVRYALALVPGPDLLVLDEPTAAMDVGARRRFWDTLRAAGRSVLFTTHHLEEADQQADRVVLLAAGRIVADGTAAAVKAVVGGRVVRSARAAAWPGWPSGPRRPAGGRSGARRLPAPPHRPRSGGESGPVPVGSVGTAG